MSGAPNINRFCRSISSSEALSGGAKKVVGVCDGILLFPNQLKFAFEKHRPQEGSQIDNKLSRRAIQKNEKEKALGNHVPEGLEFSRSTPLSKSGADRGR
jgi:hypothetical protein